jgi:hypothetical protein
MIKKIKLNISSAMLMLTPLILVFSPSQLFGQTVDTKCYEFGREIRCTSTPREPRETTASALEKLNKSLESINESRRRRDEEKERKLQSQERRELIELETKKLEREIAEITKAGKRRAWETENQKRFLDYISNAIADGRCGDAIFLALARSDLETASRVKSLCVQGYEIPFPAKNATINEIMIPIKKPKNKTETIINELYSEYYNGKNSNFSSNGIVLIEKSEQKSIKYGLTLINFGLFNGEPNAYYYSGGARFYDGLTKFNPKDAYILYRIAILIEGSAASDVSRQMSEMIRYTLSAAEIYEAEGIASYCSIHVEECYRDGRIPRNPVP